MAFAEFIITTVPTATVYGAAQFWVELPESFPPIGHIVTTTPAAVTVNEGVFIETATTIPITTGISTPLGTFRAMVKCAGYVKGTRWLYFDEAVGAAKDSVKADGAQVKLIVYYRSTEEMYNIPT
jgi:hypothetical protein